MDGETCMPVLLEFYPKLKIIVLSAFYSESIMNELLKMGATCFLPKHCDFSILLDAIVSVHKNGFYSEKESEKREKEELGIRDERKFHA